MLSYDLYGSNAPSLERLKIIIEFTLKCIFEAHESSYIGEYYRAVIDADENVMIRNNVDPEDNSPAESEFPGYKLLIYINGTRRPDEIRNLLYGAAKDIAFLQRKSCE